jgi:predicted dehydrogenase
MKKSIGVIGCSNRIKIVLSSLLNIDNKVEVKAFCDPDMERVKQFKNEFAPNAKVYDSVTQLVSDPKIEWVAIGTWNSLHAQQAIAAVEAEKHVYCEKPLATNFEDCLAIKKAFKKNKKKLMIGFTLRYSPHYRKIRSLIESGAIGKIVSFEFNENLGFNHGGHIMCGWRRKREFTGCHILEKCCHDVDLANWMVGSRVAKVASFGGLDFFRPENEHYMNDLSPDEEGHKAYCSWPTAWGKNPFTSDKDIIDNQVCILQYANGTRATFHTNLNAGIPERRMYILGTRGAIRADAITGKLELQKIGFTEKLQYLATDSRDSHAGGDDILVEYWSKMIHEDVPSLTDIKTGIESAIVCFAADEAMLKGRIVELSEYWAALDKLDNP